jgi:Gas vesicle synthesis protein GvpL/GvpF
MPAYYLYAITPAQPETSLGAVGLAQAEVTYATFGPLSVALSVHGGPDSRVPNSRDNMLAHQRTIEKMMATATVLPIAFGTVVAGLAAVDKYLSDQAPAFLATLQKIEGKVELGLKGLWADLPAIFAQVSEADPQVSAAKREALAVQAQGGNVQPYLIEVGKLVGEALQARKEAEAQAVVEALQAGAIDVRLNKTLTDAMFINAAFLVEKPKEAAFDALVNELAAAMPHVKFKYVGPLAPHNFI